MPKRRLDDGMDESMTQSQGTVQPLQDATAEDLANRLCRFVLLREHTRKPIPRLELKNEVMQEHSDRSGKAFKQVMTLANEKLRDIVGLELVLEADGGAIAADEGGFDATQPGPSQGASASQAASKSGAGAAGGRYVLVNRLEDPVAMPLQDAPAIYLAFVEVVLNLIHQSAGQLDEPKLFEWLEVLGLSRTATLGNADGGEKIEGLVSKRLVAEAYLRRRKKVNDPDTYEYTPGARATLNRSVERADEFREKILTPEK